MSMDMEPPHASSRLLEACNTCRKRKVKCDRQRPTCAPCNKSRMECTYTDRLKLLKAPRRRPTRAKQFEDRLEKVESLLKLPVAVLERMAQQTGMMNGLAHTPESTSNESDASMADWKLSQQSINGTTQAMKNIAIASWAKDGQEAEDLTGQHSDQPVQERDHSTGTSDTGSAVRKVNSYDNSDLPRIFRSLPPKDEAISLLGLYFARFNSVFPLHHQQSFMQLVHTRYSTEYDGDVGWWSNINMALAHGCRIRTLHSQTAIEDDEDSWGYLENALSMVPFLAVRTPSLSSIQALLGIAVFLQATPVPRSYSLLVANAIRVGHSIGLHRRESYHNGIPTTEIEQRKRVFWLCYLLDRDVSMRSGQPPVQHDDDIDVDLPCDSLSDGVGYIFLAHGLWPMNFLRLRIQLAFIQGAIYRDLYSAKATKQSDDRRAVIVQELDERLRQWKNSTSIDFQPEFLNQNLQEPFDILHIVILYFTYFNCLILIHRSSFQNMSWKTRAPNSIEPFNPRNFSSKPIVIETARSALNLLKLTPGSNYSCIWLTLQFSTSAIITLLRNIHINPTLPNTLPDFKLVDPMLGMFCKLASRHVVAYANSNPEDGQKLEKSGILIELMRMRDFCFVLRDRAKAALDVAMTSTGYPNGATELAPTYEIMQQYVNKAEMSMQPPINSNEKPRSDLVQGSETTIANPLGGANGHPAQANTSLTHAILTDQAPITAAPEVQHWPNLTSDEQNGHDNHISFENSMESIISHPVNDSQEFAVQEESGLWNWWDLIEMDIDNNKQMAPSDQFEGGTI